MIVGRWEVWAAGDRGLEAHGIEIFKTRLRRASRCRAWLPQLSVARCRHHDMSHPRSRTNIVVHVVWTTRFRQPVVPTDVDAWLRERVRTEAAKVSSEVLAVGNTSDHVHAVVKLRPTLALSAVMQQIKGGSSHAWNRSGNGPLAWQDGYWAESCNPLELEALLAYVNHQRVEHDDQSPFDAWQAIADL